MHSGIRVISVLGLLDVFELLALMGRLEANLAERLPVCAGTVRVIRSYS